MPNHYTRTARRQSPERRTGPQIPPTPHFDRNGTERISDRRLAEIIDALAEINLADHRLLMERVPNNPRERYYLQERLNRILKWRNRARKIIDLADKERKEAPRLRMPGG